MSAADVRRLVAEIADPELPVLTIEDLGILREVSVDGGAVTVTVTPTYSGCPAMGAIRQEIEEVLAAAGYAKVSVRTVLAPPWTTDWISERGRRRLAEFGIAPPAERGAGPVPVTLSVVCPRCGSTDTRELSRFSSTACKALYRCESCAEPFDAVKVL